MVIVLFLKNVSTHPSKFITFLEVYKLCLFLISLFQTLIVYYILEN